MVGNKNKTENQGETISGTKLTTVILKMQRLEIQFLGLLKLDGQTQDTAERTA